ncbi:BTAD domain-containing putative transcriptional regulator [Nonomuraea sp. NPDC050663]|uniref:AfsR/SARP family transcriptional regulator n=1 Tax=Nonomuraea sp. NPDC050663 TaxID=3364370 RepID=UPI0037A3E197
MGDTETVVPGRHGPGLLAGLALMLGGAVPEDQLIEWVWGPSGATVGALRTGISRLRSWLREQLSLPDAIELTNQGYRLDTARIRVDAVRFLDLAAQATEPHHPQRKLELLKLALAEWRAPVLEGALDGLRGSSLALRLEMEHTRCIVDLADTALDLDQPALAVEHLEHLALRQPYDEHVHARLVTALGASGRRAEGLRRFEAIKVQLAEDLGIDPSPVLRQAQSRLLLQQARGAEAEGPARADQGNVNMLPLEVADYTAREEHSLTLTRYLAYPRGNAMPIAAISGMGGVGKTVLALHLAHQLRTAFPGGQLYVDLHGAASPSDPVDPAEVLSRFLRVLGVRADAMPTTLDERAELFRTCTAHNPVLVMLDNAADEKQVLPLLPGSARCAVLVTSRKPLGALAGAHHVSLPEFSLQQATGLLEKMVSRERLESEPCAVRELLSLCGGLPLALRIVGAKLAAKPHWSASRLVAHLRDERHRLDELAYGSLQVRASIALSHHDLDAVEQRAFQRLGHLEARDITSWMAAALLELSVPEAERILERLVDAQLLQVIASDNRKLTIYRFHDLVRVFAREQSGAGRLSYDHLLAIGAGPAGVSVDHSGAIAGC